MNWGNFRLERFALVLIALGTGIVTMIRILNTGAPALPLKARQEIVARDRAFLEAAPPEAFVSSAVIQKLEPLSDGPVASNVTGDRCYGKACVAASLQTYCVAAASLPTCSPGGVGTIKCSTNSGADGGMAYVECDGASWRALGGGGSSSTDTCTGVGPCLIGYGGIYTDGGIGAVGAAGNITAGGTLTAQGNFVISGGLTVLTASANVLRNSAGTGLINMTAAGPIEVTSTGAFRITGTGSLLTVDNSSTAGTYLRSVGDVTASLPTCNAGIKGALETDTTLSCIKFCNGSAWSDCLTSAPAAINNYWSTTCFGVCGEDVNFQGGIRAQGTGSTARVVCSWGTAGSGGTTGVVLKIRNVTAGTTLCTCTVGACTIAASTPTECTCAGTYTSANIYSMQLDGTTDCAGNPSNIVCTAMVGP